MKLRLISAACLAVAAGPVLAQDDEPEDWIQRVYLEYVKGDMHDEYRAVVSDWNDCISAADDSAEWWVFKAETGDLDRYAFVLENQRWSDFDEEKPELEACYEQFKDRYHATVDKVAGSFDIFLDEHSHHVEDDTDRKIAWVTSFELNDSMAFLENVKKYAEAARENDWKEPFYFYSAIGGKHHSGIFVVSPTASFADLDGDNGFWKMLEAHFGEEEFGKMRDIDRQSIDRYYGDIWVRVDELSSGSDD